MSDTIKGTEPNASPEQQALEQLKNHSVPKVREAAEAIANAHARRSRILTLVQEAMSQLRLDMKYLVYDLECTRRERDELQAKLDAK